VAAERERVHPLLPGLGPLVVEQQDRDALEGPTDVSAVRTDLPDDLPVPFVALGHAVSSAANARSIPRVRGRAPVPLPRLEYIACGIRRLCTREWSKEPTACSQASGDPARAPPPARGVRDRRWPRRQSFRTGGPLTSPAFAVQDPGPHARRCQMNRCAGPF